MLLVFACSLGWTWITRTVVIDEWLQVLAGYLAVWLPLVVVLWVADAVRGRRSRWRDFGFGITWIDLLWGAGAGLVARGIASLVELGATGRTSLDGGVLALPTGFALWFGVILAPVVLAPLVEETFYRGLLLRALARRTRGAHVVALALAVVVCATVFALMHLAVSVGLSGTAAWMTFTGALVLGLATGVLAATTGRLGSAIIAHVVFNGTLIAALLAR
ncbi:CPBP family intramembrane glutamic endopeptidase [Agromyces subbeticus]|uniref:CPBP family intramembrane glutamic endopeptidase n=1 Tax=Agromyces subbeticus TaxID=293890 RepID=UPI0004170259|nr:CPBP family intramembrane glutamic endopeptidase [Agromyces subbeticus]